MNYIGFMDKFQGAEGIVHKDDNVFLSKINFGHRLKQFLKVCIDGFHNDEQMVKVFQAFWKDDINEIDSEDVMFCQTKFSE